MSIEGQDAATAAAGPPEPAARSAAAISTWCVDYLAKLRDLPSERIDAGAAFESFAMDSIERTTFLFALEELLNVSVTSDDMVDRPTIAALADYLASQAQASRGG